MLSSKSLEQFFGFIHLLSVYSRVNHNEGKKSPPNTTTASFFLSSLEWGRLQVDTDGNNKKASPENCQLRHPERFQHTSSETITIIPVLRCALLQCHTSLKSIREIIQGALLENKRGQIFWTTK